MHEPDDQRTGTGHADDDRAVIDRAHIDRDGDHGDADDHGDHADDHDDLDDLDDQRTPRRRAPRGSLLAAGMLGLDQALGRKVREEAPIVIAASDDPIDIDRRGITVAVDEGTSVVSPPQPRADPLAPRRRRRRRS